MTGFEHQVWKQTAHTVSQGPHSLIMVLGPTEAEHTLRILLNPVVQEVQPLRDGWFVQAMCEIPQAAAHVSATSNTQF